jgi:hypothetical protein
MLDHEGWPNLRPGRGQAPISGSTTLVGFSGGEWSCEMDGCKFRVSSRLPGGYIRTPSRDAACGWNGSEQAVYYCLSLSNHSLQRRVDWMSPDFRVRVFQRPRKVHRTFVTDTWGLMDSAACPGYVDLGHRVGQFGLPRRRGHHHRRGRRPSPRGRGCGGGEGKEGVTRRIWRERVIDGDEGLGWSSFPRTLRYTIHTLTTTIHHSLVLWTTVYSEKKRHTFSTLGVFNLAKYVSL